MLKFAARAMLRALFCAAAVAAACGAAVVVGVR